MKTEAVHEVGGEGAAGPRRHLRPARAGTPRVIPLLYGFHILWCRVESSLPLTRYRLYRRDEISEPTLVAELSPEVNDYWDFTARRGSRYAYSVAAANPLGEGALSDEAPGVFPADT